MEKEKKIRRVALGFELQVDCSLYIEPIGTPAPPEGPVPDSGTGEQETTDAG